MEKKSSNKASRNMLKTFIKLFTILMLIVLVFYGIKYIVSNIERSIYRTDFFDIVEYYGEEYDIDKYFIFSVIKTESNFNELAVSNVGAKGLMQIMEPTFDWVLTKIPNDEVSYDNMYLPKENIMIGAFLLDYLYEEFQSEKTAIAAYHAGRSAVHKWLNNEEYSSNGIELDVIPSKDTAHYVNKVMHNYEMYKKIYKEE